MKKTIVQMIIISTISWSAVSYAEDFSSISNDDLFNMKDQVLLMDDSSKDAYRNERQTRMDSMDHQTAGDERFAGMGASGKRNMEKSEQRNGSRKRDGSGGGKQRGKGDGQASGDQARYGQQHGETGGGRRGGGRYGSGQY